MPHHRELAYASLKFSSIEINGSFYSLQRPSSYKTWYEQTPGDFVFSVKGGRYITHMKKLRDVDTAVANFFASGLLALEGKLGPILWQFPPNLGLDLGRFERFFSLLPKDTNEAARLARNHNRKLKERAYVHSSRRHKLRHAVEIRNSSFLTQEFIKLLRKWKIALVLADSAGNWPYSEDITADFVYIRLHGAEQIYWSSYSDQMLDGWSERIGCWSRGDSPCDGRCVVQKQPPERARDVFVYFDNDAKVAAPFDAMRLAQSLDATPTTFDDADELVPAKRRRQFARV